jgi:hypothetical protein
MNVYGKIMVLAIIGLFIGVGAISCLSRSVEKTCDGKGDNILINTNQNNDDPVACFYWSPQYPEPGEMVRFDASCSYDPDGTIIEYYWSFTTVGIPHFPIAMGDGEILYYYWGNANAYVVTLTVTDNDLAIDGITKIVIVGFVNQRPNTPNTPSGPSSGSVGTSYSYSTSTTDPDGDQIKYGFDWDGNGVVDDWSSLLDSGDPCSMSYSWSSTGTYQVKVKAQDVYGAESEWSSVLTVTISAGNNAPDKPDTPSGQTNGKAGISYTYSTSTDDPDGGQVWYKWDWGDEVSNWDGPYNSGDPVTTSHKWSNQGTYAVKVKAKDTSDVESVWSDPLSVSMPKNKQYMPLGVILAFGFDVDVKIVQLEPGEDYVDLEVLNKPFYIWENELITRNPGEFIRLYSAKGLFSPSLPFCFGICQDWGIIG